MTILVSGCSYTSNFIRAEAKDFPYYNHEKWPSKLERMKDTKTENIAMSGNGAKYIFHSLVETIEANPGKYKTVIAAYTTVNRDSTRFAKNLTSHNSWDRKIHRADEYKLRYKRSVDQIFTYIFMLDMYCRKKKINLFQFQLGPLYNYIEIDMIMRNRKLNTKKRNRVELFLEESGNFFESWLEMSQENDIRSTVFYNSLPASFYREPDGSIISLYEKLDLGWNFKYKEYPHWETSGHYNEEGHEKVAEWVYNEIQRLGY